MERPLDTATVEFPSNGGMASGYLASPSGGGSHPAVVVIQEWWGLDDHIRDLARRFARAGFIALAPDLYHGQVTAEPDEAHKLMMSLRLPEAHRDLRGASEYLLTLDTVQPRRVGVVGFCMGGSLTLYAASHDPNVGVAAAFYPGRVAQQTDDVAANLGCPLLAIFGAEDDGIPPAAIEGLRAAFERSGKADQAEIVVYDGAPHAFLNDTRPSYRPEAAADAWQRTIDLFQRTLAA
jgi:carboxymethylenebutenolidase